MLRRFVSALALVLLCCGTLLAQSVGIGTGTPHPSARLDVTSTNSGFLPPRMTTAQRNAIAGPAAGLVIYNTTVNCLEYWDGTAWQTRCGTPVCDCAGPAGSNTAVFTTTGSVQTWTVPAGVTCVRIKAWGGGGGAGGGTDAASTGMVGGGGGYATAVISVTPGEVLNIRVGGGGGATVAALGATQATAGYNGGGAGGVSTTAVGYGGGGGGASDVYRGGTPLVVAAGGGGSGVCRANGLLPNGGPAGVNGGIGNCTGGAGAAGTITAGGAGGATGICCTVAGIAGGFGTGGAGGGTGINTSGGGGGGGYYGGGGGAGLATATCTAARSSGGGGGSSYTFCNGSTQNATNQNAANNADVHYAGGAGQGGTRPTTASATVGGNGRVVIVY